MFSDSIVKPDIVKMKAKTTLSRPMLHVTGNQPSFCRPVNEDDTDDVTCGTVATGIGGGDDGNVGGSTTADRPTSTEAARVDSRVPTALGCLRQHSRVSLTLSLPNPVAMTTDALLIQRPAVEVPPLLLPADASNATGNPAPSSSPSVRQRSHSDVLVVPTFLGPPTMSLPMSLPSPNVRLSPLTARVVPVVTSSSPRELDAAAMLQLPSNALQQQQLQHQTQLLCDKPLSSGWATALAAASIANSARTAGVSSVAAAVKIGGSSGVSMATVAKRRANTGSGASNANSRTSARSLFCLSVSNPLRKLSISIVEWKYPFACGDLTKLWRLYVERQKVMSI
jgi:hypothetical protein